MSGVRNSCETAETKSDCSRATANSRLMARAMRKLPRLRTSPKIAIPPPNKRLRGVQAPEDSSFPEEAAVKFQGSPVMAAARKAAWPAGEPFA